jgi:AraC-like DNA-binding protein
MIRQTCGFFVFCITQRGNVHGLIPNKGLTDREWLRLARSSRFRATELANSLGVSLRTLERHFRARFGLTVSEWLKSIRLAEASARIRSGERIKEVAFALGYKQLSHFSREFKRAHGKPPTQMSDAAPARLKKEIASRKLKVKSRGPATY